MPFVVIRPGLTQQPQTIARDGKLHIRHKLSMKKSLITSMPFVIKLIVGNVQIMIKLPHDKTCVRNEQTWTEYG